MEPKTLQLWNRFRESKLGRELEADTLREGRDRRTAVLARMAAAECRRVDDAQKPRAAAAAAAVVYDKTWAAYIQARLDLQEKQYAVAEVSFATEQTIAECLDSLRSEIRPQLEDLRGAIYAAIADVRARGDGPMVLAEKNWLTGKTTAGGHKDFSEPRSRMAELRAAEQECDALELAVAPDVSEAVAAIAVRLKLRLPARDQVAA